MAMAATTRPHEMLFHAPLEGAETKEGENAPVRENRVEDIYLRYYNGPTTDDNTDIPLGQASRLFEISGFDKNNPTVLYIHGFNDVPEQENILVTVNAYLEARPDTNVILLDWSNMAKGYYMFNAAGNTKKVGIAAAEQFSKLIDSGLLLEKFHIIGHSLGGHTAGSLARELKNTYNKTVKRLTALDPSFPAFYPDGASFVHVNANDAEFVDVIHTDAGATDAGGYGAPVPTGTVDFWPNGGKGPQPGCPTYASTPLSADDLCNHWRSWRYYAESVLNPEAFPASPAESYQAFKNNSTPESGVVYLGINIDTNAQGSFYLTTNAQTPFGKGMAGLYP